MTTIMARKRRQAIDLPGLHAECEANYLRLHKILPDLAVQDRRYIGLPRMLLPDEKQQWNFLLGEWLTHCLAHGYSLGPDAESWHKALDWGMPRETGDGGA